jgi:peptidyl-prolyl cis-trans isomerase D
MLQAMRSSAKYFWLLIVIAFVGGFLLYESSGLFGRARITSSTTVAKVNGDEILFSTWQRAIQQLEQQQTQGSGRSLTLDEQRELENQAFEQLVGDILINQEIKRRHIVITDDELAQAAKYNPPQQLMQSPELQTNGQFDYQKYLRLLSSPTARQNGLLYQLEMYYRDQLPKEKLYEQVVAGVYPSDAQLWQNYQDSHDTAQISYAAFKPTGTDQSITVSDDEIRSYYDTHKKDFERPGRAVVTFTQIRRSVSAADSAAVRQHALDLRARILGGEKFEDVAKAESADSASAVNGGDLGAGPKGRFVAPFEAAAEQLQAGEISQPVLTQFGYHLIRLDSRHGDTLALHHILLRIQQSDSDATQTDREADSLAAMAAGTDKGAKFDSAVKTLGLDSTRALVTEGEPLVWQGHVIPSVSAWAFQGAKPGETSDLFSDDNGYYLARLESVTPGGIPSLDDMKSEIRVLLARQKELDKLVGVAQKFATAAAASSLEQAGQTLNTPITQSPQFTRFTTVPGVGRANQVIGAAFTLPIGAVSAPIKTEDAVYVIRVDNRTTADSVAFAQQKGNLRKQTIQAMQQSRIRDFLQNLRESADIKDNRKEIKAAERAMPAS